MKIMRPNDSEIVGFLTIVGFVFLFLLAMRSCKSANYNSCMINVKDAKICLETLK